MQGVVQSALCSRLVLHVRKARDEEASASLNVSFNLNRAPLALKTTGDDAHSAELESASAGAPTSVSPAGVICLQRL